MADIDLIEIESRIKKSRQEFRSAFDEYDADGSADGKKIIEKYLEKFVQANPKRSAIARATANEIIAEIKSFETTRTNLIIQVAHAGLAMNITLTSLAVKTVAEFDADFVRRVREFEIAAQRAFGAEMATPPAPARTLEEAVVAIKQMAASLGEQLDKVQTVSATVIQVRGATLKAFKEENVEISIIELSKRLREEIAKETKSTVYQNIWKGAADVAAALLELTVKVVVPAGAIFDLGKLALKIKKMLTPDTAPGATDIMQDLLPVLKEQTVLLNTLNEMYDLFWAEFTRIQEAIKSPT